MKTVPEEILKDIPRHDLVEFLEYKQSEVIGKMIKEAGILRDSLGFWKESRESVSGWRGGGCPESYVQEVAAQLEALSVLLKDYTDRQEILSRIEEGHHHRRRHGRGEAENGE